MMRIPLVCAALSVAALLPASAQLITEFGADAFAFGDWTYDSATSTLAGTANVGDLLFGSSASLNIEGATGLSFQADTLPDSLLGSFQVILEDENGNSAWTEFFWEDFSAGAEVTADFALVDEGFDFASVQGWSLVNGGTGSNIQVTLGPLNAVPEPSVAVVAIGGVGCLLLFRRRLGNL